jgi:hypothetical protein
MIRIVDRNEKYIVQKIISQVVKRIDANRDAIYEQVLRYQVVPVDNVGNTHAVEVCETLAQARELVKNNMEAWAA